MNNEAIKATIFEEGKFGFTIDAEYFGFPNQQAAFVVDGNTGRFNIYRINGTRKKIAEGYVDPNILRLPRFKEIFQERKNNYPTVPAGQSVNYGNRRATPDEIREYNALASFVNEIMQGTIQDRPF